LGKWPVMGSPGSARHQAQTVRTSGLSATSEGRPTRVRANRSHGSDGQMPLRCPSNSSHPARSGKRAFGRELRQPLHRAEGHVSLRACSNQGSARAAAALDSQAHLSNLEANAPIMALRHLAPFFVSCLPFCKFLQNPGAAGLSVGSFLAADLADSPHHCAAIGLMSQAACAAHRCP
jgi:hypothetical protein